jgi:hypothetical protein
VLTAADFASNQGWSRYVIESSTALANQLLQDKQQDLMPTRKNWISGNFGMQ